MSLESPDPTVVQTVVVTADDLRSALETNRSSGEHAVLRLTPPFSGRMRARLHVELDDEYDQTPAPIHVEPRRFVDDSVSAYPRPADTEDELRADPDREYTVERHREHHAEAIEQWREQVPDAVKPTTTVDTPAGTTTVDISLLGNS